MSAASAKPALTLKDAIELLKRAQHARNFIDKHINVREAIEILKSLEAQPAAERTALKNLHDSIEAMRQEARRDLRNPPDDGVSKNFDVAFFGGKSLGLLRARQEVDKLLSGGSQR